MKKESLRKIGALVAAGALLLTGCGSTASSASSGSTDSSASTSSSTQASAESVASSSLSAIANSVGATNDGELIKVGVTFGDLSNPVWADCANTMQEEDEQYGLDVTAVGCTTSEEQIKQCENFVTAGCKAIVVGAKDTKAMGPYAKTLMDQGIVVFALGYEISNFTADMMVKNYDVGYAIAEEAAKWVNEKFDGKCDIVINDYPDMDVLVDRVDGMEAALKDKCPNATVVAKVHGTTTAEILPEAENAFTANPNVKVCIAIGDGGALAFREAAKGMGLDSDDFGIFGVDCTEEVAKAIYNDDLIRASMSLGGGKLHAETIMATLQKIFAGEDYEKEQPYPQQMVTRDNVEEVAKELGYTLS